MKSFLYIPLMVFTSACTLAGAAHSESTITASSGQELIWQESQETQVYHLTSLCLARIEPINTPEWFPQELLNQAFEIYCGDTANDPKFIKTFWGIAIKNIPIDKMKAIQLIKTNLCIALTLKHTKLLKARITSRQNLNEEIEDKPTLMWALEKHIDFERIKLLLNGGINPNVKGKKPKAPNIPYQFVCYSSIEYQTPLTYALTRLDLDLTLELIKASADLRFKNHRNETALDILKAILKEAYTSKQYNNSVENLTRIDKINNIIQLITEGDSSLKPHFKKIIKSIKKKNTPKEKCIVQ